MGSKGFSRVLSLGILALGVCAAASAAGPAPPAPSKRREPIAVKTLKEGRIRLDRGGRKRVVNLRGDIAGCTGELHDYTTQEKEDAELGFEIVDETEKGSYTYVVLLASAPAACNVQGHCGAGGNSATVVWLKVNKSLSVIDRQNAVIEDCLTDTTAEIAGPAAPDDSASDTIEAKDLHWTGDLLRIDYTEGTESTPNQLTYDRRHPEAGLRQEPRTPHE